MWQETSETQWCRDNLSAPWVRKFGAWPPGLGAVLLLLSGLQFPHASREDWISKVLCIMVLSFQRTGDTYNNIIFLWSETSTKNNVLKNSTTKGTMVFIVTLTVFESFHLKSFWFGSLSWRSLPWEHPPHTAVHVKKLAVLFLKPWPMILPLLQTVLCSGSNHGLIRVPSWLIYYLFLTFHCLSY